MSQGTMQVTTESLAQVMREQEHNSCVQLTRKMTGMQYADFEAMIMAQIIKQVTSKCSLAQQCMSHKGLKKFGKEVERVMRKEVRQLHDCTCWAPISVADMNANKRRRAQLALTHSSKTSSGEIKGQLVFDRKPTREHLGKEDSASPTASMETIFLTYVIDAHEHCDAMWASVPNASIQAVFLIEPGEDRTVMKITRRLVGILVNMHLKVYEDCMVIEKGKKVLHVETLKAMCGMLEGALCWCRQFRRNSEEHGFVFNNFDPCVANKVVKGKEQTVQFHIDDLMLSYVDKKVND